jgi:hypothetical protein
LDENLLTSAEEISRNEPRRLIVSNEKHNWVNRLSEMLFPQELEEAKTSLEALMQKFAGKEQHLQSSGYLGPDAPILPLIVGGLYD